MACHRSEDAPSSLASPADVIATASPSDVVADAEGGVQSQPPQEPPVDFKERPRPPPIDVPSPSHSEGEDDGLPGLSGAGATELKQGYDEETDAEEEEAARKEMEGDEHGSESGSVNLENEQEEFPAYSDEDFNSESESQVSP